MKNSKLHFKYHYTLIPFELQAANQPSEKNTMAKEKRIFKGSLPENSLHPSCHRLCGVWWAQYMSLELKEKI